MDLSKSYEVFQPEKLNGRIHIIGCGSVGSTIAENLARCGVEKFTLWDFDTVEPHNIANQMFRASDIGKTKVEALLDIMCDINPDIKKFTRLKKDGWHGEHLSGYVFLAVDNIEIRKQIVSAHIGSPDVIAMFDFRTRLFDAQHYAADWSDSEQVKDFFNSMDFTHEEAKEETPVSACNVTLGVCPTVRSVVAYGIANFMNFATGKPIKTVVLDNTYAFMLDAF